MSSDSEQEDLSLVYDPYFFDLPDLSDEELTEEMADKQAASKIHRAVKRFSTANPPNQAVITANVVAFSNVFASAPALWVAYATASKGWDSSATFENQITQATAIANAATALRAAAPGTIKTTANVSVNVASASAPSVVLLAELHRLVISKMTGNSNAPSAGAAEMFEDFKSDLTGSLVSGMIPESWYKNQKIWKMCKYAEDNQQLLPEITEDKPERCLASAAAWAAFYTKFNRVKQMAPTANAARVGGSNKFAVDSWVCTIAHFKKIQEAVTVEKVLTILTQVSNFTNMSRIGILEWNAFCQTLGGDSQFVTSVATGEGLYDNPAKMTRARLFACAATVSQSSDPTSIFALPNVSEIAMNLLAEIYKIEKDGGIIKPTRNTTSTSEHLMHLLLTLGNGNGYWMNRNNIPTSARAVNFITE